MSITRLYYQAKPLIPRWLRFAVRRRVARRILRFHRDVWPIKQSTALPLRGWSGWPGSKKFAFVLSHDIEGPRGYDGIRQLAELEMALGFRSSFNFVPEGNYAVLPALRSWLVNQGFEVGIHDLHHDGKLYSDRKSFLGKARRINHYLDQWNAVGFRSAFMLHNYDWLHALNVLYDASSFDTDPFEPQPDGVNTIFPFWVPSSLSTDSINHLSAETNGAKEDQLGHSALNHQPSTLNQPRSGYIELPYTLAQDSTLFLTLQEKTIAIWKRKLDWIADHGGMAMVNIHPDYIQFGHTVTTALTYSHELILELLEYVQTKYGDTAWYALPREVAEFAARHKPRQRHQPRRICMVAYTHYEADARVRRYAESLAERGDHVDVVALKRTAQDPVNNRVGPVNLFNLQLREGKTERSRTSFLLPLLRFLAVSTAWITLRHARRPYDLVHVHNMPDFLVFAAAYPKLTGARVILDIHDIVPEFYGNKFGATNRSTIVPLLKVVERLSARVADHVIISNDLWFEKFTTRNTAKHKSSVVINNVDTRIFRPHPRTRHDGKLIVLFPGGLQWHQGLDIALRAFKTVSNVLPNVEFHIYGEGIMKPALVHLARELGFNGNVRFFPPVRVSEIAEVMANADLGVVPKRADSFGNEAYSTKIMEFMSQGVPAVISRTAIDSHYFSEREVRFCESGNQVAFAEGMIEVLTNKNVRDRLVQNGREYVLRNNWGQKKHEYLDLVDRLIVRNTPAAVQTYS
jgi:glycosyltransferase involved in cell wall biosynthesis